MNKIKWIFLTDDPPPIEEDVLVYCIDNTMRVWCRTDRISETIFWETEYGDWMEKDEVVAWAYLPEPPILV